MKNLKWFFAFLCAAFGAACDPVPLGGGGDKGGDVYVTIINQVDPDGDCQVNGDPLIQCLELPTKEERDQCLQIVKDLVQSGYTTTSMSCGALSNGDCDTTRGDVCSGCAELCDNRDNDCNSVVDDGLSGCCDDQDICTNSHFENFVCVHTPITGCCNADSDCSGATPRCTSQSAMTAGSCVRCTANADCDDGLFCNGQESCANNICQGVPGGACPQNLTCDETNNRCVGCLSDAECPLTQYCNANVCVQTNCDDGNICTVDSAQNHTQASCTHTWTAGCCRGPTYDADCTAVNGSPRPANLPSGYDWGCSTQQQGSGWYECTECDDSDMDNQCPNAEWCGNNGWDDDGDGLVDETPCVQQPPPDAGVSDSGTPDVGTPDSGVVPDSGVWPDASVQQDAGSGSCLPAQTCQDGYYWACNQCVVFVDSYGRTGLNQSGLQSGPDQTPDNWDNDGDCYCEVHTPQNPCLGTTGGSCASFDGGDCDDTQTGFANHPDAPEWPDNYDNNCNGVVDG